MRFENVSHKNEVCVCACQQQVDWTVNRLIDTFEVQELDWIKKLLERSVYCWIIPKIEKLLNYMNIDLLTAFNENIQSLSDEEINDLLKWIVSSPLESMRQIVLSLVHADQEKRIIHEKLLVVFDFLSSLWKDYVPQSVIELFDVKYMNLDNKGLTNFPIEFCALTNLKTLSLRWNSIPSETINLLKKSLPYCEIYE